MNKSYSDRLRLLQETHETLITRPNKRILPGNGIFERYEYPVLTNEHTPLEWRYDLNPETNPWLMERIGVNAAMNSGAIKWNGKYLMVVRVEGNDRKSFFAIAESPNGIDNFRFWEYPIQLPDTDPSETNVYDMRLTAHEDGWIYGIFCSESLDPNAAPGDLSFRRSESRYRPHQRLEELGTPAEPDFPKSATQRRPASGICQRQICFVHPSAGQLY